MKNTDDSETATAPAVASSDLLCLKFDSQELGRTVTLKQYFILLAQTVWDEAEGFSGKRPWGNSSWQYEVYAAMIRNGFKGKLDEDGSVEEIDTRAADETIFAAMARWRDEV